MLDQILMICRARLYLLNCVPWLMCLVLVTRITYARFALTTTVQTRLCGVIGNIFIAYLNFYILVIIITNHSTNIYLDFDILWLVQLFNGLGTCRVAIRAICCLWTQPIFFQLFCTKSKDKNELSFLLSN